MQVLGIDMTAKLSRMKRVDEAFPFQVSHDKAIETKVMFELFNSVLTKGELIDLGPSEGQPLFFE